METKIDQPIINDILDEIEAQDEQWGSQNDKHATERLAIQRLAILGEEFGKAWESLEKPAKQH